MGRLVGQGLWCVGCKGYNGVRDNTGKQDKCWDSNDWYFEGSNGQYGRSHQCSDGSEKFMGKTETDEECAALVRQKEPNAVGASRMQYKAYASNKAEGICYAAFGATHIWPNFSWRTCVFGSKLEQF